jgi:hypothetical protein
MTRAFLTGPSDGACNHLFRKVKETAYLYIPERSSLSPIISTLRRFSNSADHAGVPIVTETAEFMPDYRHRQAVKIASS